MARKCHLTLGFVPSGMTSPRTFAFQGINTIRLPSRPQCYRHKIPKQVTPAKLPPDKVPSARHPTTRKSDETTTKSPAPCPKEEPSHSLPVTMPFTQAPKSPERSLCNSFPIARIQITCRYFPSSIPCGPRLGPNWTKLGPK